MTLCRSAEFLWIKRWCLLFKPTVGLVGNQVANQIKKQTTITAQVFDEINNYVVFRYSYKMPNFHGPYAQRGIFCSKSEIWTFLQLIEKIMPQMKRVGFLIRILNMRLNENKLNLLFIFMNSDTWAYNLWHWIKMCVSYVVSNLYQIA